MNTAQPLVQGVDVPIVRLSVSTFGLLFFPLSVARTACRVMDACFATSASLSRRLSPSREANGPGDPPGRVDSRGRRGRSGGTLAGWPSHAGAADADHESALPGAGHSGGDPVFAAGGQRPAAGYRARRAADCGGGELGEAAEGLGGGL